MMPTIGATLLSGGVVGFSLGLVGGGGSILAMPSLLYVVGTVQPHIAIGTSALAVSVNAFASLAGHARAGNVRWRCAIVFSLIGTLGALAGSTLGKIVDGQDLLFLFGLLMVVVGMTMLRPRRQTAAQERSPDLRTCLITGVVAFAAGLSGFFGIGGGFLIVPAEAHETLISLHEKLSKDKTESVLASAGIDVEQAKRDLAANQSAIDATLARNNEQALALGFQGTPACRLSNKPSRTRVRQHRGNEAAPLHSDQPLAAPPHIPLWCSSVRRRRIFQLFCGFALEEHSTSG